MKVEMSTEVDKVLGDQARKHITDLMEEAFKEEEKKKEKGIQQQQRLRKPRMATEVDVDLAAEK